MDDNENRKKDTQVVQLHNKKRGQEIEAAWMLEIGRQAHSLHTDREREIEGFE